VNQWNGNSGSTNVSQKDRKMPLKKELIYIDGEDRTDSITSYSYVGDRCFVTFKNNGKSYAYGKNKIKIVKSAIDGDKSDNLFRYLNKIADIVGLTTEEGKNILADSYSKITFIPEFSILANYLNGKISGTSSYCSPIEIFPFGFNISQKEAVNKAFSCHLSVI